MTGGTRGSRPRALRRFGRTATTSSWPRVQRRAAGRTSTVPRRWRRSSPARVTRRPRQRRRRERRRAPPTPRARSTGVTSSTSTCTAVPVPAGCRSADGGARRGRRDRHRLGQRLDPDADPRPVLRQQGGLRHARRRWRPRSWRSRASGSWPSLPASSTRRWRRGSWAVPMWPRRWSGAPARQGDGKSRGGGCRRAAPRAARRGLDDRGRWSPWTEGRTCWASLDIARMIARPKG